MGNAIRVVHVVTSGETAKHGPAEQTGQQTPGVPAATTLGQRRARQIGQTEDIIDFAIRQ